jgi:uncharacterized protein YceH (UPF0502 family)
VELSAEEQRVLGCLLEKAATTPEHYPLTMNALVAACNQTSNRDPVVTFGEETVAAALASLRERKLIRIVYPAHARVTKYRHVLDEAWALSPPELAVVAVLLLRGAQTQNELAVRTERYLDRGQFDDMGGISGVLDRLARRPEPLARLVARRPGQREDRYVHLLGTDELPGTAEGLDGPMGATAATAATTDERDSRRDRAPAPDAGTPPEPAGTPAPSLHDRILALESETAILRRDLATLTLALEDLLGGSILHRNDEAD